MLHANDVVPRERLIDELWGGSRHTATALQVHISQLRKLLGSDRIETRSPGTRSVSSPARLDLERFQSLIAQARGLEPVAAAGSLRQALSMWQGPPLAELEGYRSPGASGFAWRSCIWPQSRRGSRPISGSAATPSSCRLERLVAEHPLGSGCADS